MRKKLWILCPSLEEWFWRKGKDGWEVCHQNPFGFKEIFLLQYHLWYLVGHGLQGTVWGLGVGIPVIELGTWQSQVKHTALGQAYLKCFLNKAISNFIPVPQWNFPYFVAGSLLYLQFVAVKWKHLSLHLSFQRCLRKRTLSLYNRSVFFGNL